VLQNRGSLIAEYTSDGAVLKLISCLRRFAAVDNLLFVTPYLSSLLGLAFPVGEKPGSKILRHRLMNTQG
jgi:hypothetical protein